MEIKNIIDSIRDHEKKKSLLKEFDDKRFFKLLASLNDEEKSFIDELLLTCIDEGDCEVLRNIAIPVLEKKRFIDWKKKSNLIGSIFDKILAGCSRDSKVRYSDFVEKLMEMLNSQQLTKEHAVHIYKLIKLSFDGQFDPELHNIHLLALHAIKSFPFADEGEKLSELMVVLRSTIEKFFDTPEDTTLATNIYLFFMFAFYLDKSNGKTQKLVIDDVTRLFEYCADQDWQCSEVPSKNNLSFKVLHSIMEYYIQNMGMTRVELVKPMYKRIVGLRNCGEESIENLVKQLLSSVANETDLVAEDAGELLEAYLDGKMDSIENNLKDMYPNQPHLFRPLMPRFSEKFINSSDSSACTLIMFFTEVAKKEPDTLPEAVPQHVTKYLSHQWYFGVALMFFDALATTRPDQVIKYENDIIRATQRNENAAAMTSNLLPKIATDEGRKMKYLNYLAEKCRSSPSGTMVPSFVNSMRIIGSNAPKLLAPHKELFEEVMETNPTARDICRAAINVIEGKSLEKVAEDFKDARKDMDVLQVKMETIDTNVDSLKHDVIDTRSELHSMQNELNENLEKIDHLELSVTETKAKVEEIDHKTLSHTPSWSREVSKLLNQSGDRDWRLLARRLGYSNDDVINWATQPDPCMSMLDDWFATHKTRDATHGVLKVLDDMERKDAYSIVEEAVKDAEYMVGDDDDDDEDSKGPTPTVFLSYQWALQSEVKLLRKHLTMCGYPCWMDVGQMGGGDKLYAKIDGGMRAAKVVVCCVSERYAESPNCNREVNLAVNLGKPMIPLLMEKMGWPPKGGMGPIFGEYLFVRFYRRDGEGSDDDGLFWPPTMFNQLIMQIRYSVAPLQDLIPEDSPYKNWWNPPEEVIVIKKKEPQKVKDVSKASTNQQPGNDSNESPLVFISYQWDLQKEIKDLYRKLMSRELTCWLDINMMGGGDSLYDKIDKGIRGARVVLNCVTKKYALSSNCRREVALSDAIKKPLIPLLLEEGAWPPEGPMGMVLTPLLYVDFSQSGKGAQPWDDEKKFNELLEQIQHHVNPNKNSSETNAIDKKTPPANKNAPLSGSKPVPPKPLANQIPKSKQPINKPQTSAPSFSSNRKPSSSSSTAAGVATKTRNKVLKLFKTKSSK